jgi:predicted O-methyltransferase YrrM
LVILQKVIPNVYVLSVATGLSAMWIALSLSHRRVTLLNL